MLPVTVCLPVLNDEMLLQASLENLDTRVAEILILDFGSSDHSTALAQRHAARIISLAWEKHWGSIRAAARQQSSQPWLLWLHPGETLTPENWRQLEQQLATAEPGSCQELICQTAADLRCEPRLFASDNAEYEQDILFPIFRNQLQAEPSACPVVLEAQADSWSRRTIEADSLLDLCCAQNIQTEEALFLGGLKAFENQMDEKAEELFSRLLALPDQAQTYCQLTAHLFQLKLLWEKGLYQEAFEELERFRHDSPLLEKQAGLWVMRGVMARHVQETELARECFHEALSQSQQDTFYVYNPLTLRPDITWKPWLGLGDLYIEHQLYNQAFHAYLNAYHHTRYLPGLNARLLRAAFLTREYPTLEILLAQDLATIHLSESMQNALKSISSLALHQQANPPLDRSQAEALLQQMKASSAVEQDPFLISLSLEYALLLLKQGMLEGSRLLLQYLSLKLPGQVILWHNLAYSYFAERNYTEAEKYYRQALQVEPDFSESRMDLGKVLVMQGKIESACEEFEHILQRHPHHLQARKALAQLRGEGQSQPGVSAVSSPQAEAAPFIFLFPLSATWENGFDIAIKAYYEEFVASDNVILVIPELPHNALLEKAEAWARQKYTPDLLPPILQITEPLPLLPDQTCFLLPFRLPPSESVLEGLRQAPVPALYPGVPLDSLPMGYLPAHCHAESVVADAEKQTSIWWEVELQILKNQMRLCLENTRPLVDGVTSEWNTHTLFALEGSPQTLTHSFSAPESTQDTRISVCMIVRDEAHFIRSCLQSFIAEVDEVIVVDTGSRDQTLDILHSFPGVQVFEQVWTDDFSAARNAALAKARCPWILVIDADEYLPDGFIPSLKAYLKHHKPGTDAYVFSVVALDEEGLEKKEDTLPVPRLFANNPVYRFQGRIHELLVNTQKERMTYIHLQGLPIYHRGYQEHIRADKQKLQRDTSLMMRMIQEQPGCPETERMYLILGQAAENEENWKEALRFYEQGQQQIVANSSLHEALRNAVWRVELKRGNPQRVFENELPDNDPEALLLWAEAARQLSHHSERLQACERALHLWEKMCLTPDLLGRRPTRESLLQQLVQAYTETEQPDQALYFCERLIKENTEQPDYWLHYRQLRQESQVHARTRG